MYKIGGIYMIKKIISSILISATLFSNVHAINWGLSYTNGLNQPPNGEDTVQNLAQYNTYFMGDTSKKTIYLTFDAGYENGYTATILDVLKKQNVPVAFFLLEHYIDENPELVKRMANEGHIVGNHTSSHPNITKISNTKLINEVNNLSVKFNNLTGRPLDPYFRPPEGSYAYDKLQTLQSLGYNTILWSVAYPDWDTNNQPSYESALNILNKRMHNGAIILLHSTSSTNAGILDTFITNLKNQGYEFAYLSSLPQLNTGVVKAIPSSCKFYVNSKPVNITSYMFNNTNYIKLRDFAAALDGTDNEFDIDFKDNQIIITKNSEYSYVGSELSGKSNVAAKQAKKTKQTFNSQSFNAYSIENNNYVSIRELCDAFGVQISYDALTNSVNMQVK